MGGSVGLELVYLANDLHHPKRNGVGHWSVFLRKKLIYLIQVS